jgi:anti-sigma28 factor (negative regulator of flagellin synthesis)
MRIDPKVVTPPVTRDATNTPSTAAKSSDLGDSASVVKLSAAATGAASAADTTGAAPTTTSRLQTIRAMLDKGNYPVDLDLLASRIVDDEVLRAGRP